MPSEPRRILPSSPSQTVSISVFESPLSSANVSFISPSFITPDGEDHYIHLDFTHTEKNNNIYLGILADAILKGFNDNYDTIGFKELRSKFIDKIHEYFEKNNIDSTCFLNLFSNNNYFPDYLKENLIKEFNKRGEIKGRIDKPKTLEPIIFTTTFETNYKKDPFNFINNKEYNGPFNKYIKKMDSNEYDRQYLLDALGKFLGYLSSSESGSKEYKGSILNKILVYGTNDLYLPNYNDFTKESIIKAICHDLKANKEDYNNELIRNYLIICLKFLEKLSNKQLDQVLEDENISKSIFNKELDTDKMDIDVIKGLKSFNEIGTYHNYTSKVMPKYTKEEGKFLSSIFPDKDKKVLDIMCGYGRLANELKQEGFRNITGIDSEKYEFLGIPKDFTFIKDDYLSHQFKDSYDYAYSLYNCYPEINDLMKVIGKTHSVLNENGLLVIDYFNKKWRDSVEQAFFKELYKDDKYRLIIKRDYNSKTGEEETYYELFYDNVLIKVIPFIQKFFTEEEVLDTLGTKEWDTTLYNSDKEHTRTNAQKNIMILRKKK